MSYLPPFPDFHRYDWSWTSLQSRALLLASGSGLSFSIFDLFCCSGTMWGSCWLWSFVRRLQLKSWAASLQVPPQTGSKAPKFCRYLKTSPWSCQVSRKLLLLWRNVPWSSSGAGPLACGSCNSIAVNSTCYTSFWDKVWPFKAFPRRWEDRCIVY